jgi:transcription elongation factor GreA
VIARAEVVSPSLMGGNRVRFGAWVTLEDIDNGETKRYRIVGADEANVAQGTISVTSPVAQALINHEVGDEVKVKAPAGVRTYEISDITWK